MSKIYAGNQEPQFVRDRRFVQSSEEVVSSLTVKQLKHLTFGTINSIQFCVDSAVGLPLSVTASRVTARLLAHDRSQIGEPSAPSFSDPDSEPTEPRYDLHMGWRGDSLRPSLTILCRIDTLEKPSLVPRCVGFAVLKLCVDITGEQPSPTHSDPRIFLNAGQYRLPIVYGRVPAEGDFSESLMDQLPHIQGAYLNVRLFDPSVDTPASSRPDDGGWSLFRDAGKIVDESSVAGTLIQMMDGSSSSPELPRLPISDAMMHDIKRGLAIGEGEKNVVLRQFSEWMMQAFPPLRQKIPLIDPRFMMRYEEKIGAYCALDMLFNMPARQELLRATKDALGMTGPGAATAMKKFDNHIKFYKTYFRYLPGSSKALQKKREKDPTKQNLADLIIDDASLDLDLSSHEYNPVFRDDFSRTVGIELSPHACLLVVVTAVDILTTARPVPSQSTLAASPSSTASGAAVNGNMSSPSRSALPARGGTRGSGSGQDERRAEEERAFKLRGLVGAYFGNHEPDAVWFGIIPLVVEGPFHQSPTRISKIKNSSNAMPANRAMRKRNDPAHAHENGDAVLNFNQEPGGSMKGVAPKFNSWTSNEETKVLRSSSSSMSEMIDKLYFVNAGTHQVPLFCGFPPDDLLKAPDPMAWLLSTLSLSANRMDELSAPSSSSCWCSCRSTYAIIDPSDADYNARRGKPILKLSPGASAMVSLVDPRLRQFSNNSVTLDPNVQINEDVVIRILKARFSNQNAQAQAKAMDDYKKAQALKMFKFKMKSMQDFRTYRQAIPDNIFSDTLMEEIGRNFIKSISE